MVEWDERKGPCYEWYDLVHDQASADRFNRPGSWDYCDWCGWWGWIETDTDLVLPKHQLVEYDSEHGSMFSGPVYCLRCEDLEEPPWWPNNRDRFHELILRNFQPPAFAKIDSTSILRLIAEYVAENRP